MRNILLQATGDNSAMVGMIAFAIVMILLFIALRGLVLWYYKLDVISKNLEEQTKLLNDISEKLNNQARN
ncbi:hypothetical protein [Sphingobacterium kyonggiense]